MRDTKAQNGCEHYFSVPCVIVDDWLNEILCVYGRTFRSIVNALLLRNYE